MSDAVVLDSVAVNCATACLRLWLITLVVIVSSITGVSLKSAQTRYLTAVSAELTSICMVYAVFRDRVSVEVLLTLPDAQFSPTRADPSTRKNAP